MLKLRIKPEAENDLSKIFEYTALNWGSIKLKNIKMIYLQ